MSCRSAILHHRQLNEIILSLGLCITFVSLDAKLSAQNIPDVGGETRAGPCVIGGGLPAGPALCGLWAAAKQTGTEDAFKCLLEAKALQYQHCKNIADYRDAYCKGDKAKAESAGQND